MASVAGKSLLLTGFFPTPWPPVHPLRIASRNVDGELFELDVDTSGRIEVALLEASTGLAHRYLFQPVRVEGGTFFALTLHWAASEVRVTLNNRALELDRGPTTPSVTLPSGNAPVRGPMAPIFPELAPNTYNHAADRLLAEKVKDLDERIVKGTSYDLLQAAALVRQLLLDGASLIDQVNRRYRHKLAFTILDLAPPGSPTELLHNLDPAAFPGATTKIVSRDQFLSTPCLMTQSASTTVKDVIQACANAKGGVHTGTPGSEGERSALDWDQATRLFGEEPSLRLLSGIGRVLLRGILPLVSALRAHPSLHAQGPLNLSAGFEWHAVLTVLKQPEGSKKVIYQAAGRAAGPTFTVWLDDNNNLFLSATDLTGKEHVAGPVARDLLSPRVHIGCAVGPAGEGSMQLLVMVNNIVRSRREVRADFGGGTIVTTMLGTSVNGEHPAAFEFFQMLGYSALLSESARLQVHEYLIAKIPPVSDEPQPG